MFDFLILLAQAEAKKDPGHILIFGDWGEWNTLQYLIIMTLIIFLVMPMRILGGYSLLQVLNLLCLPSVINRKLFK